MNCPHCARSDCICPVRISGAPIDRRAYLSPTQRAIDSIRLMKQSDPEHVRSIVIALACNVSQHMTYCTPEEKDAAACALYDAAEVLLGIYEDRRSPEQKSIDARDLAREVEVDDERQRA